MMNRIDNPNVAVTVELEELTTLAIYLDGQKVGTVELQQDTTINDTRYVQLIGRGLMIEDPDGGYLQHATFGAAEAVTVRMEEPV